LTDGPGIDAYEISSDRSRLDLGVIHGYLRRSYWSADIPLSIVETAVRHSLCFGVFERASGHQVGFARVVTDHATFAYLCDVFVLEEHRGRGLSKALMRAVVSHASVAGARRAMLATRDAHGLYRRFGFADVAGSGTLMEIVRPDIYSRRR
jgi:GNAT superfamily N-acetyltransferase